MLTIPAMRTNQFQLLQNFIKSTFEFANIHRNCFGIDKMVGLDVDYRDVNKPVSAAQNALDLKANLASPTFTGTVSELIKQWLDCRM
jgi:hypothetical protein